jgi:hypothetical protein
VSKYSFGQDLQFAQKCHGFPSSPLRRRYSVAATAASCHAPGMTAELPLSIFDRWISMQHQRIDVDHTPPPPRRRQQPKRRHAEQRRTSTPRSSLRPDASAGAPRRCSSRLASASDPRRLAAATPRCPVSTFGTSVARRAPQQAPPPAGTPSPEAPQTRSDDGRDLDVPDDRATNSLKPPACIARPGRAGVGERPLGSFAPSRRPTSAASWRSSGISRRPRRSAPAPRRVVGRDATRCPRRTPSHQLSCSVCTSAGDQVRPCTTAPPLGSPRLSSDGRCRRTTAHRVSRCAIR